MGIPQAKAALQQVDARPSRVKSVLTDNEKSDTDDDESWAPKKVAKRKAESCEDYNEGTWLDDDELVYLLHAFRLAETTSIMAYPHDQLSVRMTSEKNRDNTEWHCDIVNTDTSLERGCHWILALWRWHRQRISITLWEPYGHTKYSGRVLEAIKAAIAASQPRLIPVGQQKDGWQCGYICVWWQMLVQKLIREGSAPAGWSQPPSVPGLWVNLCWSVLRVAKAQRAVWPMRGSPP